jgi:VIT1/CCC1 family predicted Fe2+/Mn2+ transporter
MATAHHRERHFGGSAVVRDVVLGMSDGLTVPFALAAGLSGAVVASHIIVTAGLAEIVAGSISMGLGGYLAGRGEIEHYENERRREHREVQEIPAEEEAEVAQVFARYGLSRADVAPVIGALRARPDAWVDFMMRFELGLEEPDKKRALVAAATIGIAYAAGGLVPLAPYFFASRVGAAVPWSVAVTSVALVVLGYVKARFTGAPAVRSALQTLVIGGLAAATAWALARAIA